MAGRYALIIANAAYQDAKLSRLRTPARDAEELARVLRDPKIGDFEVELSLDEPEHALRRRIAAFFASRERDDLLLLHFSCHGLKDDSGELYFAAADTEVAHLDATAVSADFVSRQMTRSRSRKVVALLDCCYSGAIARGLRFRAGETVQLDDHLGGHGRVILTASSAMEYAFEGDELTGSGTPSVFTGAVVRGLQTGEADRDQDRRISVEDLYDYVCEQVRQVTPDQTPNMLSHLEGELYIARSSWVAPVEPAELSLELRSAIDSPLAGVREGAVAELARLEAGADRGSAVAARLALAELVEDDSRRVAAAAAAALGPAEPAVAEQPALVEAPVVREEPAVVKAPVVREEPAVVKAPVVPTNPVVPTKSAVPTKPAERKQPAVRDEPAQRVGTRPSTEASVAAWSAQLLAGLGAALVLASLTVFADVAWPPPYRDITIAASIAAAAAALLVVLRGSSPGVALDAGAAALAAFPLGVGLAALFLAGGGWAWANDGAASSSAIAPGVTVLGSLLLLGGALWHPGAQVPEPLPTSAVDNVADVFSLVMVIGSFNAWGQEMRPAGWLMLALLAAFVVGTGAAIGGMLKGRAREIAAPMAVVAPAAGVMAVAAALLMFVWLRRTQGSTVDSGLVVTLVGGAGLAVASSVSLARRLMATSR